MQTELTLIFGTAVIILLWRCSAKLSTIIRQTAAVTEAITQLSEKLEASTAELHALAAHFVPRLETETDIAEEQHYVEARQMGFDRASEYFRKTDEKGG